MRSRLQTFSVVLMCVWAGATRAAAAPAECVLVVALDEALAYESDATECSRATAPASTFKLPHVLIALQTGVVTDPNALVKWDGTQYANASWNQDHSLLSAVQWSALWFFQRTAKLIGRERMLAGLQSLDYAKDGYEGEQTQFWLNGDLQVTPHEELSFLQHLERRELPVPAEYAEILEEAFLMPPGKVRLAAGERDFMLQWPALGEVHAKTGNAVANGEAVSWLVGYFDSADKRYVFVARSRAPGSLPPTAGVELAQRVLNTLQHSSAE